MENKSNQLSVLVVIVFNRSIVKLILTHSIWVIVQSSYGLTFNNKKHYSTVNIIYCEGKFLSIRVKNQKLSFLAVNVLKIDYQLLQGSYDKLEVFELNSWPNCVAISRDIARNGSNSDYWFTRKMSDRLILKLIFSFLDWDKTTVLKYEIKWISINIQAWFNIIVCSTIKWLQLNKILFQFQYIQYARSYLIRCKYIAGRRSC